MRSALVDHVATEVRVQLTRQRRTQAELAARLNLSQPTIARRLNGEVPFDLAELEAMAEWFGLDVEALIRVAA